MNIKLYYMSPKSKQYTITHGFVLAEKNRLIIKSACTAIFLSCLSFPAFTFNPRLISIISYMKMRIFFKFEQAIS